MRSALGLAASALAGLAALIASQDGDGDIVPFFVGLTFLGGMVAWATHPPFVGRRRRLARGAALLWALAALWAALLLAGFSGATSRPPPVSEATYLGLSATIYHVAGLYGGAVLAFLSAFLPDRVAGVDARGGDAEAPSPSANG